jgi:WD40 repeat protein
MQTLNGSQSTSNGSNEQMNNNNNNNTSSNPVLTTTSIQIEFNHSINELQNHLQNNSNNNSHANINNRTNASNSPNNSFQNGNGIKQQQPHHDSKLSQLSNINKTSIIQHINNNSEANSNTQSQNSNGAASSSNGNNSNGSNSINHGNSNQHNHSETTNNQGGDKDDNDEENDSSSYKSSKLKQTLIPRVFSSGQKDILRLIGQHLRYLGLNKTTELLVNESGCMLEHPTAASFCGLIMSGKWDEAEGSLNSLKSIMEDSLQNITNMKFLILEQKYLECLEDGKILEALKCLRDELAPLKFNTDRLHELSSFLMCSDQLNLKVLSKWSGKSESSRQSLMEKLQSFLPPNVMLPPRRLEALLHQAIEFQCDKCSFHNFKEKSSIDSWSFLRDHACSKEDFPTVTLQIINDHCDEVWYCKFSNNGKHLASGSKDGCLCIWDVDPETYKLTLNKTYEDHTCGVALITWSPDDRYVIVCGTEESTELWIWDIEGKVLKKRSHDDSLTSAAWLPDGQSFVTGGIKGHFYNCDMDGNIRETWEGIRVRCLQTLPDGQVLAADSLKRIRSYNFKDISDANIIQEDFQIMSFTLNKVGSLALISVVAQGIHLWDIKDKILLKRYQGNVQNNYTNYCTFGGADEAYLASGSEDNRVYIWNVKMENPISILEGHTRSVTCVTWNPEIPGMVVSASDDGTLRVWGPKSKQANNLTNLNGSIINGTNSGSSSGSGIGGGNSGTVNNNNSNNLNNSNGNNNNLSNNHSHNSIQPPPPPPPPPASQLSLTASQPSDNPNSSSSSSAAASTARFASTFFSSSSSSPQIQPQIHHHLNLINSNLVYTSSSSSTNMPQATQTPAQQPPSVSSAAAASNQQNSSNSRSDRSTPV